MTLLAEVLDDVRGFVCRYVVVGDREADAVALWIAHTYVYDAAPATPYLHPYSPEPGSGKTTLLDVLALVSRDAIQADNLTEAVLFRLIHKRRPTLLFDEVDAVFGKKNSDSAEGIRQVLNSGYRRGKQAFRCVPPSHEVQAFDVYCPKATAGLHELPATLAHRSIPIAMQPPRPDENYEELDHEEVAGSAEALRVQLRAWAEDAIDRLGDPRRRPAKLHELDARSNEIWRILFRVADDAGGDWPARARTAAVALSGGQRRQADTSTGVQLLGHLRDLFDTDRMTCQALVDRLNGNDLLPYGGWKDGKGISTRQLGKKLSEYGVHAKTIRLDAVRANGYMRDQFEDAWARYLPQSGDPNRDTVTTRMVEPNLGGSKPRQNADVTVSGNGSNPHDYSDVSECHGLQPEYGTETPSVALGTRLAAFLDTEPPTDEEDELERLLADHADIAGGQA